MKMKNTTMKKTLKTLAMLVWYIGFIALSLKSYKLFAEAYTINNNLTYLLSFLFIAFLLSLLKTKYIFTHSCQKNLKRIEGLEKPKIWQFYRVGFFIFLIGVISLGAFLSRMASGDYYFLISVGIVDIALALALFFSGFEFFRSSAIIQKN
jgi:hypothetical protein